MIIKTVGQTIGIGCTNILQESSSYTIRQELVFNIAHFDRNTPLKWLLYTHQANVHDLIYTVCVCVCVRERACVCVCVETKSGLSTKIKHWSY